MNDNVDKETSHAVASHQISPGSSSKHNPTVWFTAEIQQMMHGCGDCRKPRADTAGLVEEIVHEQMQRLLYQAEDVARKRNARAVSVEDFLFLLRRDKDKLRRFLKFMEFKDVKASATKGVEDDDVIDGGDSKSSMRRRRKLCHDFLSLIDQTGELVALFQDDSRDEVKLERALRAELLSRTLDLQQYKDFCEARQASFTPRLRSQRFREWLLAGMSLDIKPNSLAMDCLSYLAFETVAQIVDLALIVQRDSRARIDEPFAQHLPPVLTNHDALTGMLHGAQLPGTSSNAPVLIGGAVKTPAPPAVPTSTAAASQALTGEPITPQQVQDALRRYNQQSGPFADFSKQPLVSPRVKLLCL